MSKPEETQPETAEEAVVAVPGETEVAAEPPDPASTCSNQSVGCVAFFGTEYRRDCKPLVSAVGWVGRKFKRSEARCNRWIPNVQTLGTQLT